MTRAQWAVLSKLRRREGLKQRELADMLDLAPITLARLIDKLTASGLVERREDATDRRANRLFLTPDAAPALKRLDDPQRGRARPRAGRPRRSGDHEPAGGSRADPLQSQARTELRRLTRCRNRQ